MLIFQGRENVLRIFDGGFVVQHVRRHRRVALHHVQHVAVKIARAIEPGLIVQTGDVHHQCVAFPMPGRPAHPAVHRRRSRIVHVDGSHRAVVFIGDQNHLAGLHDLKRKRHVGGARNARQVALHFRIQLQPVRVIFFFLLRRCRQIGNLAAFHHADARRLRAGGAQRHHLAGLRRVALQIPVGRVHGLPDAVQIRLAVGGSGRFVGLILRVRRCEHGCRGNCAEHE